MNYFEKSSPANVLLSCLHIAVLKLQSANESAFALRREGRKNVSWLSQLLRTG